MISAVQNQSGPHQVVGVLSEQGMELVSFTNPPTNLAVGTLQAFLDQWMKSGGATQIDYVHGDDVVCRLAQQPGNLGFYVPALEKSSLFKDCHPGWLTTPKNILDG